MEKPITKPKLIDDIIIEYLKKIKFLQEEERIEYLRVLNEKVKKEKEKIPEII